MRLAGFQAGSISGVLEAWMEKTIIIHGVLRWTFMAGKIENGTRALTGSFKTASYLISFTYVLTRAWQYLRMAKLKPTGTQADNLGTDYTIVSS